MEKILNKLPQTWEDRIIPLMEMNNKFVLGGSIALHILKIINYDFTNRTPDIDFSLIESFEEKEFLILLDFFNLSVIKGASDYEADGHPIHTLNPKTILERELIMVDHVPNTDLLFGTDEWSLEYYRIDFFNKNYLKKKDWFELNYFGTPIKITHPSIILAAKMKYATDSRVGKQYKHFQDIQGIDWNNYFPIIKRIQSKHKEVQNEGKGYSPFKYVLDKYIFNDNTPTNETDFKLVEDEIPF